MTDVERQTKRRKLISQDEGALQSSSKSDSTGTKSDDALVKDDAAPTHNANYAANASESIVNPAQNDISEPRDAIRPSREAIDGNNDFSSTIGDSEQAHSVYAERPASEEAPDAFGDRQLRARNHSTLMNREWLSEEQRKIEQAALYKQRALQIDPLGASPAEMRIKASYEEESRRLSREMTSQTDSLVSSRGQERDQPGMGTHDGDLDEAKDEAGKDSG